MQVLYLYELICLWDDLWWFQCIFDATDWESVTNVDSWCAWRLRGEQKNPQRPNRNLKGMMEGRPMRWLQMFLLVATAMAWTREEWEVQKVWTEVTDPDLVLDLSDPKLIQKYCDQKLDHFDEENTKTWCQRFLINATFQKPNGPAFICIDGEDYPWLSGERPYTMACHNMVELAKDFGAIMLAVEHRYYGGADFDGVTDFDTKNLKYLSSRQALADLAGFWTWISTQLEPVSSVVVFGGSYPGSLSAWARKLYPETFKASVASSAPLLAQANFWGYNDVVASALTAPSVGGSPECLSTYAKGHAELGEMMTHAEGRRSNTENPTRNGSECIILWTSGVVKCSGYRKV